MYPKSAIIVTRKKIEELDFVVTQKKEKIIKEPVICIE